MVFAAVFLALAVFTGTQASFMNDEPQPRQRLEQIQDTIREYLQSIRNSELGKGINTHITEGISSAQSYQAELQKQLPPAAQQLLQKFVSDLQELKERVEPFTEDLKQKVQGLHAGLAPYAEDLLDKAEQHTETLRQTLTTRTEELRQRLQQNVNELGPYADQLKARVLQHFQELEQGVEQLQSSFSQVRDNLYPYAEQLPQKLIPLAEDLQNRLNNFWTSALESFQ